VGRHLTRWLIPLPAILFTVFSNQANAEDLPICPPENLVVSENDTNILLDWDAPSCGLNQPERYAIFFTTGNRGGWGVATGNVGGPNSLNTYYTFSKSYFGLSFFNVESGSTWRFRVRSDNDTLALYSTFTEEVGIAIDTTPTTTTTSSTTTTSTTTTTTTTLPETTTTTSTTTSSTTTLPQETTTTTEPTQTSTTTSTADTTTTTTTTTSTTVPPTTTTTEAPYTPPQTTTTTPTIETQPEPTTTEPETTVDEPETTEPETSTTYPDETLPELVEPDETTIPETFVPYPEVEPAPDETEQPTEPQEPQEYIPETTLLEVENSSPTTVPELETEEQVEQALEEVFEDEPVTDEQVEQILETLSEAEPEQIVAAITQVLAADITSDQATEIASSPEVLAAITETQAEELFEQIEVEELTDTQLEAFTETIQQAPTKVKEAFEKTIDIFGSQFDNYTPTGSNIPVGERRTIVAVGALIAAIPPTRIRR
jgi:hypothetical protein